MRTTISSALWIGLLFASIVLVGGCALDRAGLGGGGDGGRRGVDAAPGDGGRVDAGRPDDGGETDAGRDAGGETDAGESCPPPATEVCGGGDEDCDGAIDEGCECTPGATRACGESEGACEPGEQTCGGDGTWGDCEGAVGASAELCDAAMVDEDCDGVGNEDCACAEGETRTCTSGSCTGMQTCDASGSWGDCTGLGATTETCNGRDDDCNGTIDDGDAGCEAETGCTLVRDRGSAYLLCSESGAGWSEARAACPMGYDLVTIDDAAEQDFVQSQTSAESEGEWWIGLKDVNENGDYEDGEWTGEPSSYRNWKSDNPDHTGQCAMLVNGEGGAWDDKGCGGSKSFVCEAP